MSMSKFRQHRGGLGESMETVVTVDTRDQLLSHARRLLDPWGVKFEDSALHVEPYGGIDHRIGWDTYIVTINGYGVLGMTDGPLPPSPASSNSINASTGDDARKGE